MAKCPECGKEINHLNRYKLYSHRFEFRGKGDESYRSEDFMTDDGFDCPECGQEIFQTEEFASNFLKGEN